MRKLLVVLFAFLLLQSCDEFYYGQGYVFIQNKTESPIWCDVTYNLGGENDPKFLYHNAEYGYQMNYGDIYVNVSIDGQLWYFHEAFLEIGENLKVIVILTDGEIDLDIKHY